MSNRTIDLRALDSTTESIIYQHGGLFPVADRHPDGDIAVISRGGAGHIGLPGRLDVQRSRDGGVTFTPPEMVVNSGVDDRNPAFGFTPSGTLILVYMQQASYDDAGQYVPERRAVTMAVMRSVDRGLTWSEPIVYPEFDGLVGSPFGRLITLPNGSIGWNLYSNGSGVGRGEGSYLVVSHDDGITWERPRLIAADHNETALLSLPGGDILAAARLDARDRQSLSLTRSSDNGVTWSPVTRVTGPMQHPADLVLLGNDQILLTYGNRQPPYRVEGMLSDDGGHTWGSEILLFSGQLYGYDLADGRRTDLGYPSSVVDGDRVTTFYYYNPDHAQNARDWSGAKTTGFYLQSGYRCIATSWSIAELRAARSS